MEKFILAALAVIIAIITPAVAQQLASVNKGALWEEPSKNKIYANNGCKILRAQNGKSFVIYTRGEMIYVTPTLAKCKMKPDDKFISGSFDANNSIVYVQGKKFCTVNDKGTCIYRYYEQ